MPPNEQTAQVVQAVQAFLDQTLQAFAAHLQMSHNTLAELSRQSTEQAKRMATLLELLGRPPSAPAPVKARSYNVDFKNDDEGHPQSLRIVARGD